MAHLHSHGHLELLLIDEARLLGSGTSDSCSASAESILARVYCQAMAKRRTQMQTENGLDRLLL